ncbi:MAG: DUF4266 domain-containing protein [Oligoflexia bacterium]|nr:DUF4266 domain-containing protein [Oligoflexia bacterium]
MVGRKILTCSLVLLCAGLCGGCVKVKPWEKGNFTKAHMAFDPDPLEARFYRHVYESKEAASGGYGVSVVGCGCK